MRRQQLHQQNNLQMLHAGITGGIGSGKSTVATMFSVLGIPVYNADYEAKKITNTNPAVIEQITAGFGVNAYINGVLNSSVISAAVFNNPQKLQLLNSIIHPPVFEHAHNWRLQKQAIGKAPYTIKEAAIFFESGSAADVDIIIGVYAPKELRIQRIMQRSNITRQQIMQRMSQQINEEIKMRLCDFVITNDEKTAVIPQVLQLHEKLVKLGVEGYN
jgi:dephospho-CoA kinase